MFSSGGIACSYYQQTTEHPMTDSDMPAATESPQRKATITRPVANLRTITKLLCVYMQAVQNLTLLFKQEGQLLQR